MSAANPSYGSGNALPSADAGAGTPKIHANAGAMSTTSTRASTRPGFTQRGPHSRIGTWVS